MAAGDILKIEITPGTIFRVVLILIGGWFLYLIGDLLIMLFAAVVVASAIRPVADFLQPYRVPRAVAVLLVYGVALLVVAGVVTLMIPPLTEQTAQLLAALPQVLERLGGLPAGAAFSGGELIRHAEEVLLRSGDSDQLWRQRLPADPNIFLGALYGLIRFRHRAVFGHRS